MLDLDGAAQRVDDAGELDQQPVTHGLHQATATLDDLGLEDFLQISEEPGPRPFLVTVAQPAIADHIGDEDGSKPAFHVRPPSSRNYQIVDRRTIGRFWGNSMTAI